MKCLFAYTDIGTRNLCHLQYGVASISGVLKEKRDVLTACGGHHATLASHRPDGPFVL